MSARVEAPLQLQSGKIVKPFEGLAEFKPVDWGEFLSPYIHPPRTAVLLQRDTEFLGRPGYVAAIARASLPYPNFNTLYPMGSVGVDVRYDETGVEVKQIPLYLELGFQVESLDQLRELTQFVPRVEINGRTLYARHRHEDAPAQYEEAVRSWTTEHSTPAWVTYVGFRMRQDLDHSMCPPLPYDLPRLQKEVGLEMILRQSAQGLSRNSLT